MTQLLSGLPTVSTTTAARPLLPGPATGYPATSEFAAALDQSPLAANATSTFDPYGSGDVMPEATPALRLLSANAPSPATGTAATAPDSPEPVPDAGVTGSGFAGGDFQTFLKMLTTQIKNQDPLNPMEGSDFAVQLATFSGVEQQARTNQLLEQMTAARAEGLGSVAGWIGKEVRTTAPVWHGGDPLRLDIRPAEDATTVQLVALDRYGREAARETLPAQPGEITWSGRAADGTALPPGPYSFKLVSLRGADIVKTAPVGAYARVTGAELTSQALRLTLPGGASALESEVTALRDPT